MFKWAEKKEMERRRGKTQMMTSTTSSSLGSIRCTKLHYCRHAIKERNNLRGGNYLGSPAFVSGTEVSVGESNNDITITQLQALPVPEGSGSACLNPGKLFVVNVCSSSRFVDLADQVRAACKLGE